MLLYLLVANTAHFTFTVLSAFVFFSASLLYFDSWQANRKNATLLVRSIGFLAVALTQALHATFVSHELVVLAFQLVEILGLGLILVSLVNEPFLHPPKKALLVFPILTHALAAVSGVLYLLVALIYLRKATEGYEKQVKPAAIAFFILGAAKLITVSYAWADTPVVYWSKLLSKFGTIWNIQSVIEFAGVLLLGLWIWGYIRFRLQIQIFVMTIALTIFIFITTTVFFTYLLLNNLQADALGHLETDVSVMQYSLEALKSETLAHTQAVASDNAIKQALIEGDSAALTKLTNEYLITQNASMLVIADPDGKVIIRAENPGAANDSLAGDPVFSAALMGEPVTTLASVEGLTPELFIQAAVPIKADGAVLAAAVSGIKIDNSFVDGVKSVTGLDTTIFGGDKRAATTLVAEDGKSRFVGTLEVNPAISSKVLGGEKYIGVSEAFNGSSLVAYVPLKAYDGKTIGMLSVAKPENTLVEAAQESINLTSLGSVILMLVAIIPAYFFSRFLKDHLEA